MLVKRYQATDMQQAMDTIIKELGSDAVVLSSRKVRKKGLFAYFQKPFMEVMVAYDPAKLPIAKKINASYNASHAPEHAEPRGGADSPQSGAITLPPAGPDTHQIEGLNARMQSLDSMLGDFMNKFSYLKRDVTHDYSPQVQQLLVSLLDSQVREELAHSIAKETDAILRQQDGMPASEVMEHLLTEQLGTPSPIVAKKFKRRVVLLLGPTGVGKTTTLVKLAANFSIKQKKKVGIINTDTYRIAAQEQIKTYADILSIPLAVAYTGEELSEALESMNDREVVFIDTAGKKPGDEQHREDVARIIDLAVPDDILLCVAASTGFAAAKEVIDTYDFIGDYRLLVTKLDETKYHGMILNLGWYAKRSLAYVTTGQNVPDDIEDVNIGLLVKEILGL